MRVETNVITSELLIVELVTTHQTISAPESRVRPDRYRLPVPVIPVRVTGFRIPVFRFRLPPVTPPVRSGSRYTHTLSFRFTLVSRLASCVLSLVLSIDSILALSLYCVLSTVHAAPYRPAAKLHTPSTALQGHLEAWHVAQTVRGHRRVAREAHVGEEWK